MKKIVGWSILCLVLVWYVPVWAEEAPQRVKDFAQSRLAAHGQDPVIIAAVKAENEKNKSLDQIKQQDQQWGKTPGVADYMKALMTSECGLHIIRLLQENDSLAEIFIMDNQGANVAMTDKTSDYWQGDEAKFQKSFNGGNGAIFVDEVQFDESAQAYLVQISVPVMDGGKAIGAITFGVDIDKI